MKKLLIAAIVVLACGIASPHSPALAEKLTITALAEKKVAELPPGPLYWRIENFPTLEQAQAAAGQWSLAAEAAGKVWLFRLGPAGGASAAGATKVKEVGPVPPITAPQYLLRINEAHGAPGSITPVHMHPGAEAFFVLAGQQDIHSSKGVMKLHAGEAEPGQEENMPMQVSVGGSTDLDALVMFVVDATKPFSTPARFP